MTSCLVCFVGNVKSLFAGPSGPSRVGPGVGHKIVSDTKQMTKEKIKKGVGKEKYVRKEKENGRKREKNGRK